jgi:probable F420-dependent oxidoreductase
VRIEFTSVDDAIDVLGAGAAEIEAQGYEGLHLAEGKHDPFLLSLAAIQATRSLTVSTSIAVAFARNPMTVAVSANDLQLASRGRFRLGLGSQVKPHITRRFSMPWSRPVERMREFVMATRAIWHTWSTGEPLNFEGEFYRHTLMPALFNPGINPYGNPPILLAAVGDRMTEVAGEVADGVIVHPFTTERYLRQTTVPALERGRARTTSLCRPPQVVGGVLVATGRTTEQLELARTAVAERIAFYGSTPAYRSVLCAHGWGAVHDELYAMSKQCQWDRMPSLISDEILETIGVCGRPEEVAVKIKSRYADLFDSLSLYSPYDVDKEAVRSIREVLWTTGAGAGPAERS